MCMFSKEKVFISQCPKTMTFTFSKNIHIGAEVICYYLIFRSHFQTSPFAKLLVTKSLLVTNLLHTKLTIIEGVQYLKTSCHNLCGVSILGLSGHCFPVDIFQWLNVCMEGISKSCLCHQQSLATRYGQGPRKGQ